MPDDCSLCAMDWGVMNVSSTFLVIGGLGLLLFIALLMGFYLKKNKRDLEKLKAELREEESKKE